MPRSTPRTSLDSLPEVFVSTTATSQAVWRAQREGTVRKIGPRLYTKNLTDPPEQIVQRNLWPLVASLVPGALIADRTAIDHRPAPDGSVFVVSDHKRDIELPGLAVRPRKGAPPLDTDLPYIGDLRVSSRARAYLDNLVPSRRRGAGVSRTLRRDEIEDRLDDIARRRGADELNSLRDEARRIAPLIGREAELAELDRLIGALQGTRDAPLTTDRARARSAGAAFDPDRLELFELLYAELRRTAPVIRSAPARTSESQRTLAFFEAYFSNFIEGTEFGVDEAAEIVFGNVIPVNRPADAHDVLGTWQIVADATEMARAPRTAEDVLALLKSRHAVLMAGRPDTSPGLFKQDLNRAGSTVFVAPDQVVGTLTRGFDFYRGLEPGFARAAFMMFLVSEVHPFTDGNGRIARIMMNAELVAAGEERIIIPTVYRSDYLTALKALSQGRNPTPLVRTLDFAQRWVLSVPWGRVDDTRAALDRGDAFMDSVTADREGIRLNLWTPGAGGASHSAR
jgi:hypothetical protein